MLVNTEVGLLAVWDPASLRPADAAEPRSWIQEDRHLLERLNEGRALFFATGGDGPFELHLHQPEQESGCVAETEEVALTVSSGRLFFGSPEWMFDEERASRSGQLGSTTVPPGRYSARLHSLEDDTTSIELKPRALDWRPPPLRFLPSIAP